MAASSNSSIASPTLDLAFDIGHSSIGWSVLESISDHELPSIRIRGTGVVIFEKNSALANQRRLHRSQRRHVRATRQRIARLEKLLVQLGVFTAAEIAAQHAPAAGHSAPWLLAARILASEKTTAPRLLTWPELWHVLRWYAHNRGYEEINTDKSSATDPSSPAVTDDPESDTAKVAATKEQVARLGTHTMAETVCRWYALDPLGNQISNHKSDYKRADRKLYVFERPVVVAEVRRILTAHLGHLPQLTPIVIKAIVEDHQALPLTALRPPKRFKTHLMGDGQLSGGYLFGRLTCRYDNRIIGHCPLSDPPQKLPLKECREFYLFRWGLLLANIRVASPADSALRALTPVERSALHAQALQQGYFTPGKFRDTVRELTHAVRDNLETMFLEANSKENLLFDPVQKLIHADKLVSDLWPKLPEPARRKARALWKRGKTLTPASLRTLCLKHQADASAFDQALHQLTQPVAPAQKSRSKKPAAPPPSLDQLLSRPLTPEKLSGRAPYARPLLAKAFEESIAGRDPRAEGGCLYQTPEARAARDDARPLDEQTNNHLVRHRLAILEKLLRDLLATYAAGDAARVRQLTLEVNRDLRTMSGKDSEAIAKEMNERLRSHDSVSKYLADKLPPGTKLSGTFLRKARVAADLDWTCPYTGVEYDPIDLYEKRFDLDHIIPRSVRGTDALEALVVTHSAINKMKGARTALQFITDHASQPVPGHTNLSLLTVDRFKAFVEKLPIKGHPDDTRRKKRRKELLLLATYEAKSGDFTSGQLTQTSQLARLAQTVVRAPFKDLPADRRPRLVALPGQVTAAVRKGWNLTGTLATACPAILEPDGTPKHKSDIRSLTHLHHALDACVLALATRLIPNHGSVWQLLTQRRLTEPQKVELARLNLFDFDAEGHFRLRDLPKPLLEQLRHKLAERRVVQHLPADMNGMRVEENTRGVIERKDGRIYLQQQKRDAEGALQLNETDEAEGKVIGLHPGKLSAQKGVRVISDNFGVAILADPALSPEQRFVIIPWHKVWHRIQELKARNGGKRPLVLRKGQIITIPTGRYLGQWMIRGVKLDQKAGHQLDLSAPDFIDYTVSGRIEARRNVSLKTLIKDGLKLTDLRLCGA